MRHWLSKRMRFLIIIFVGVLPEFLLGQYTYFNNEYAPNSDELISYAFNLIRRNDTLITYAFGQNSNFQITRKHDFISNEGALIDQLIFPQAHNGNFFLEYSECIVPYQNGYLHTGGWRDSIFPTWQGRVYKLRADFTVEWEFRQQLAQNDTIDGAEYGVARELIDGNILAVGIVGFDTTIFFNGAEYQNIQLTKLSPQGNLLWHKEINFTNDEFFDLPKIYTKISDLYELTNGDLLVLCSWYDDDEPFAMRFDSLGNYISHIHWGNPTQNDWLPWAVPSGNDKFVIAYQHAVGTAQIGEDYVNHKPRIGILDASDDAMTLSDWHIYDHIHYWGNVTDIEMTADSGYVVLGYGGDNTGNDFGEAYMLKVDSNFNELWYQTFQPPVTSYTSPEAWDLEITSDGGLAFAGNFENATENYYSSWVVKTDACGYLTPWDCPLEVSEIQRPDLSFSFYPNPAQMVLNISSKLRFGSLCVRDITGKAVLEQILPSDVLESQLDIALLAAGVYLLEVNYGSGQMAAMRLMVE